MSKFSSVLKISAVLVLFILAVIATRSITSKKSEKPAHASAPAAVKTEAQKVAPAAQEKAAQRQQSEAELDRLNDTLDRLIKK